MPAAETVACRFDGIGRHERKTENGCRRVRAQSVFPRCGPPSGETVGPVVPPAVTEGHCPVGAGFRPTAIGLFRPVEDGGPAVAPDGCRSAVRASPPVFVVARPGRVGPTIAHEVPDRRCPSARYPASSADSRTRARRTRPLRRSTRGRQFRLAVHFSRPGREGLRAPGAVTPHRACAPFTQRREVTVIFRPGDSRR